MMMQSNSTGSFWGKVAFLTFIYCLHLCLLWRSQLSIPPLHPYAAKIMARPLKLATKYQVDALRSQIIKHLERDWPLTIHGWDRVDDETHKKRLAALQSSDGSLDGVVPDPVYTILLAHSCDVPQILPTAFYVLSRQPAKPKTRPALSKARPHSRTLLDIDDVETLALVDANLSPAFSFVFRDERHDLEAIEAPACGARNSHSMVFKDTVR